MADLPEAVSEAHVTDILYFTRFERATAVTRTERGVLVRLDGELVLPNSGASFGLEVVLSL